MDQQACDAILTKKECAEALKCMDLKHLAPTVFQLNFINYSGMTFLLIYSLPSTLPSSPAAYPFLKGAESLNLFQKKTQNLILLKIGVL